MRRDNNILEDLICPTLSQSASLSLSLSRPEPGEPGPGRLEIPPRSGRLEEEEKERVTGALTGESWLS